jgi:phage protein D
MSTALLTPACRLTVGSRVLDTQERLGSTVLGLDVSLALDTPADAVSAVLAGVERTRPAVGDHVTLELGYAGSALVKVFTGTVARLEAQPMATRLVALAPAATLLTTTVDRSYTSATAADIVRDLAGVAGVRVTRAEPGSAFPAYVVDGRRSAYAHARDLADLCGLILYSEPGGGLVLERFTTGRVVHVYRHGDDLTALDPWRHPPTVQAVEAWGESPGTSRGEQAWAWLVKDFRPSLGSAGSGAGKLLLERPGLRTAAAARAAAEATLATVRARAHGARLLGIGRPEVSLGDAVRIENAGPTVDGRYQVRSVRHRLGKARGFTTGVEVWESAGQGAG